MVQLFRGPVKVGNSLISVFPLVIGLLALFVAETLRITLQYPQVHLTLNIQRICGFANGTLH